MPRAIVTVGLPGCGKSTFAAGLAADHVELNMDALREAVVVSDTHARRRDHTRVIRMLRSLGYEVELVFFDVGVATCLARNAGRARPVPEAAIHAMAARLRESPPCQARPIVSAASPSWVTRSCEGSAGRRVPLLPGGGEGARRAGEGALAARQGINDPSG